MLFATLVTHVPFNPLTCHSQYTELYITQILENKMEGDTDQKI